MSESELKNYKNFIDECVEGARNDLVSRLIRERGSLFSEHKKTFSEDEAKSQSALESLSSESKEFLAAMIQDSRERAFHDCLSLLEARLVIYEDRLISSPFASMHYDFICRFEGDEWPKPERD